MNWSADQYVKFEDERTRPVRDLIARILNETVHRAIDLGCGPGNSTQVLQKRYPEARLYGIDSSPDMIAAARKRLPDVDFAVGDVTEWKADEPLDVILSNAVLQWVPDHAALLPRLLANLAPGGSLAVQIPDNFEEPSHRLMREIAGESAWKTKLAGAERQTNNRHSAERYYDVLRKQNARVDIWRTVYHHPLRGGANAVVEWFKGTGLRPFLEPLTETERETFLSRYEAAVAQAYPAMPDGSVLLPFPRLFFVATL